MHESAIYLCGFPGNRGFEVIKVLGKDFRDSKGFNFDLKELIYLNQEKVTLETPVDRLFRIVIAEESAPNSNFNNVFYSFTLFIHQKDSVGRDSYLGIAVISRNRVFELPEIANFFSQAVVFMESCLNENREFLMVNSDEWSRLAGQLDEVVHFFPKPPKVGNRERERIYHLSRLRESDSILLACKAVFASHVRTSYRENYFSDSSLLINHSRVSVKKNEGEIDLESEFDQKEYERIQRSVSHRKSMPRKDPIHEKTDIDIIEDQKEEISALKQKIRSLNGYKNQTIKLEGELKEEKEESTEKSHTITRLQSRIEEKNEKIEKLEKEVKVYRKRYEETLNKLADKGTSEGSKRKVKSFWKRFFSPIDGPS